MKTNLKFSLLFLFLLTSCSSVITKEDCHKNMHDLGLDHGKKGMSKLTDEVRSRCSGNEELKLEDYETGFYKGWGAYCTGFNGFNMGKKGEEYKSFCPSDKENFFREKYLIGKKVYEKNDQLNDLEEKVRDLSSKAEKENTQSSHDELKTAEGCLLNLKHEIQALEQQGLSLVRTSPL